MIFAFMLFSLSCLTSDMFWYLLIFIAEIMKDKEEICVEGD